MMRRAVFLGLVFISCIASSDSLQLRKKSGKHKAKAPADEDAETYANDVASEIEKNIQDVRRSLISKHDTQNSNTIHTQASASAMKFQEEGLDKLAKAESKVEAEADDEGLKLEPAPGQNDEPVTIRNPEDYMDEIEATTDFIGSHSYENDIKELLGEIDESENKVKSLNVRVVEKQNFLDSLLKRESMLSDDLSKDKIAVDNLNAHIKALNARVERLKSEKELTQLEAQFHQYSDAAEKMQGQVSELQDVKSALYSKMQGLHNKIAPLRQSEDMNMRLSINADSSDQTAMMLQSAAEMQAASTMASMSSAPATNTPPTGVPPPTKPPAGGEAAKKF